MLANAIYLIALTALSPWILYRRLRHGRYRRGWQQKLLGLSKKQAAGLRNADTSSQCIWLHAVSVGEVNLLSEVVKRLRQLHPDLPVVISSSTDTGFDLAVERFGQQSVFFCPLDFSWAVRRTVSNLNPRTLVLAELELWPNLILSARRRDVDVLVINGRLSDRSCAGYQRFGWITKSIFASLSQVQCQDERSVANFIACGASEPNVHCSGSLKFDNAPNTRECVEVQSRIRWAGIDPWHHVWIFGSTQEGEEQLAIEIYQRLTVAHPELRLIIVPRHPERFDHVSELINSAGLTSRRRSQDQSTTDSTWPSEQVILIDTIGELRHWWGVGTIATVGGSFGDRGGQNMLEPAGYGSAVSFGPNTRNFRDIAKRLLDAHAAVRTMNETELESFVKRCLTDIPAADALGRAAKSVVQQHLGATDRTVSAISESVCGGPSPQQRAA